MRKARLVLAVVLVVGWTSTAAAECAWVLWTMTGNLDAATKQWSPADAFDDRQQCLQVRSHKVRSSMAGWQKRGAQNMDGHPEQGYLNFSLEGVNLALQFFCFPDTIDPREKKE